ncbi:LPS assembly protein LptD, partial [Proteus mirabilis]|uniref:LPS assembly protein LptD n=1 Tax=Proteus mirabilis TaxID=584 RepID=UPI0039791394
MFWFNVTRIKSVSRLYNVKTFTFKKYPHQKLDDSVNRVLPQFKSDMKVVFERQYDTNDITQTLEP